MLGIDESRHASGALRAGDDVKRERRLSAGLGPEDVHHAPAGNACAAQCDVETQAAVVDAFDRLDVVAVELHDGALAKLLFDLLHRTREGRIACWITRNHAFYIVISIGGCSA